MIPVLVVAALAYKPQTVWATKVDPWVLATAAAQSQTEFLLYLTQQADVTGAAGLRTKAAKGQYVYDQLTAVAAQTQPAVLAELAALGVEYRPFWVANMIWVRGDLSVVQAMAQRSDIAHIYANPSVPLDGPLLTDEQELVEQAMTVEWNIAHVNAPDVWAAGYTGQGVVIGGQDTGYDWDHPALMNQYRGWNGSTADHNYNWHDAIHVNNPFCSGDSPEPCDDNDHGTHTMGTMVGDDGGNNQIGMAPGAKWIGCRNMNQGNGTPASYSECYQWFIAPTDLNGQNPNSSLAPHVINNSWSCPASEGCTDPNVMLTVVQNVVAAGIVTAHAASNAGPSCSTVADPATIYDASYSVAATNSSDVIASFSSRGPVTADGSNRLKPDISAPGVSIRSSIVNGGYANFNGTSMAAPHVAGLVGLLISADPDLAGDVAAIEDLINQTAVPRTTAQGCGGDGPTDVPNNVYGWGRIDALAAYNNLPVELNLALSKSASVAAAAPGDLITYTLAVTNTHPVSATTGIVLTDTIPTGTTFVTATLPFTFAGSTVTWQMASLPANTAWTVDLVVQVNLTTTGTVINSDYAVRSDDAPTITGLPVEITVVPYQLQVSKVGPTAVAPNALITYTLSVTNIHPFATSHDLVLTDTVPDNSIFVTATLPHIFDGTAVQWQTDSLAAGVGWQVELVVQAEMTATIIENNAYALHSNEIAAITGPPVTTIIAQPGSITLYLPFVTRQNVPPTLPTNPSPTNGAAGLLTNLTLSWSSSDPNGDMLTFDVYLEANDNTPDELVAAGLGQPTFTPDELEEATTYYWQVVVADEQGAVVNGPVWHFTTAIAFALEVVNLVNQERASVGCAPLAINQQLTTAAQAHSTDMALNDFFSHTSSNGSSPWERINNAGYQFSYAAENIAAGYTTPQAAVNAWMASPGHRANILNCILEDTGVGYYFLANDTGDTNYHHYWTHVFARP
jgi:uncharacterized repeat protein (TIGR01451 family)